MTTLDAPGRAADASVVPEITTALRLADRVGLPVPVDSSERAPGTSGAATARRLLEIQLLLMIPLLGGSAGAWLLDVGVRTTTLVLAAWAVVQVRWSGTRIRDDVPDVPSLVRHVAVPFTAASVAVTAGLLPVGRLADALGLAVVTSCLLAATAFALRAHVAPRRVLLVGERGPVSQVSASWAATSGVRVVATAVVGCPDDPDAQSPTPPTGETIVLDRLDGLAEKVGLLDVDAVLVVPSDALGWPEVRRIGWALERGGATLLVRTPVDGASAHRLTAGHLAGCGVIGVAPSRAPLHVRATKAAIDRVAGAALLLAMSPLLAMLVVAIRLDSRGPGFFTQTRIGLDGKPFKLYKLRTMCNEAEARKGELGELDEGNGVLFKIRRDPRTTRVGQLLRRTSLDELPQLINVVKGEMSLVGPRPALPQEVQRYDETARRRLAERPGITGLWQVSGRSGLDWDGSVALDVRYTDNVRIVEDLRICWRTVGAVISGRGAY